MSVVADLFGAGSAKVAEVAGWATAAVLGGAMGIQRIAQTYSSTKRDIAKTEGETQVVELLRAEVRRISELNQKLMDDVQRLHGQVMTLQAENAKLVTIVDSLSAKLGVCQSGGDD